MRWPSAIPGGTSTRSVRRRTSRPRPSQRSHGCSAMRPSPRQTSHGTWRMTCPKAERVTACSTPTPPHRSQVTIGVPGSAPLPEQCSHSSTASKLSSTLVPDAASASVTSVWTAMSRPCAGPPGRPPMLLPKPPKKASKRSEIEPKPSKFGS
jgi:hypothetical protein